MKNKLVNWMNAVVFLSLIFGFAVINLITPDRKVSESENRQLKQFPSFSWSSLADGDFTKEVESYISDQFIARDQFVGVKTGTDYLVGKRDANNIYFAKDGYLIEKHTPSSIDQKQLQKYIKLLSNFVNAQVDSLGSQHVRVMIVPTAGEILKEKLPAYAPEFSQPDMLSQIKKTMPGECFIDMTTPLLEHKNEYLFYKTDHHWTTDAAFYGYQTYCSSTGIPAKKKSDFTITPLTNSFLGSIYSKARLFSTKPDTILAYNHKATESFKVDYNMGETKTDSFYESSWLQKKDKYSYFFNGNHAIVKITGENKNGKHLLVVEDSYARCMVPFLAENYETVTMIDLRYLNSSLKEYIAKNPVTDVLVLYNAVTFTDNQGLLKIDK